MAHKLIAPRMGEGVEEMTVVKWLKSEGDSVIEMEPVVEVETDKVISEIPSPAAGTLLKIIVPQDQPVRVGDVMAWIGEPGEELKSPTSESIATSASPAADQATPEVIAAAPIPITEQSTTGFISPLVRKIANENQVDLNLVKGSGENGRITKEDILAYVSASSHGEPILSSPSPIETSGATTSSRLIPHSSLRRQIAERMVDSIRTSPHVLTVMEADLSRVLAHRSAHKPDYEKEGVNLTLTAYFISAIVEGLRTFPEVNASWTDEGLQLHSEINIGMAVALGENGLIVPVIHNAQLLSLGSIARQVNDLSQRARAKKLLPDEVKGGTFTLTNHGTGGSLFASPIITQPQVGILGTGSMQKRAVVVTDADGNDSIAIRPMLYLSFVFDHRVLDGEGADGFLKKVKDTLEGWS